MVSGGLAERSIAPDCKSGLNSTVVRIHQPPPKYALDWDSGRSEIPLADRFDSC